MIRFTVEGDRITFTVRAQPRATKSSIVGEVEGALKIKLAAPPVDGAANEELIRFLSKFFSVPRRNLSILSGETAKTKIIRMYGLTGQQFEASLAPHLTPDT